MESKQINKVSNDELSLKEIILIIKDWWKYLLSKWLIIVICGLLGGGLGILYSLISRPKYTAHLSFALIEGGGSMSGLADLASSFGLGGLMSGNGGAFSGENLLEIIRSRHAVEQTLLTPVDYKGEMKTLADVYILLNNSHKRWKKKHVNKPELHTLSYPVNQQRETFSRNQDSILYTIYQTLTNPKYLSIARKDKKISIVDLNFTYPNEFFAKTFVEKLMDQTYNFYVQTRTSQSRANIIMMEHRADSIKNLYENALYKRSGYSQANINPALQIAAVPRIKEEMNAQLYGTVYTEVLKNLETLKLDMARETPLVQIIDTPRLPLKIVRFGKLKGILFGGIFGGFLAFGYLFIKKALDDI